MEYLEKLGFLPFRKNGRGWEWKKTFRVLISFPTNSNLYGRSKIVKMQKISFTNDKRENILFQDTYVFDNEDFVNKLFVNVGIMEQLYNTKIIEKKSVDHSELLNSLGFKEIEKDRWIKNIFLIALKPPKFDSDRGKCLILKKPNIKKLVNDDRPAYVVYKGRYFFDDFSFTENLLKIIGLYSFISGNKNLDYQFQREVLEKSQQFIEDEFLKF